MSNSQTLHLSNDLSDGQRCKQCEELMNRNEKLNQQIDLLWKKIHALTSNKCTFQNSGANDATEGDSLKIDWGSFILDDESRETTSESVSAIVHSTADQAVQQSFSTHESTLGLYYSGYYYENEGALFYSPSYGTYYYFDETQNEYRLHNVRDVYREDNYRGAECQVHSVSDVNVDDVHSVSDVNVDDVHSVSDVNVDDDHVEHKQKEPEAQSFCSVDEFTDMGVYIDDCIFIRQSTNHRDLAERMNEAGFDADDELNPANYPPCLRAIVVSSPVLDVGRLFLIPYIGGHLTYSLIADCESEIVQDHVYIKYNETSGIYFVTPLHDLCCTLINDTSVSKTQSGSVTHGDILRLGETEFLIHIHPGTETCDDCEPGQVRDKFRSADVSQDVLSSRNKAQEMKRIKKRIMKKYGLQNMAYERGGPSKGAAGYQDRALLRRINAGPEPLPTLPISPSSTDRALSEDNKGHKMLKKLGWSKGQSLGRHKDGIIEPIQVKFRLDPRRGLGSEGNNHDIRGNDIDPNKIRSLQNRMKAKSRFDELLDSERDSTNHNEVKSSSF